MSNPSYLNVSGPFFNRLDKDIPPEVERWIQDFMRNPQQKPTASPLSHLNSHTPVSVAAGRMVPRYQSQTTGTGSQRTIRTFDTRTPNANTAVLFRYFRRALDAEVMSDQPRAPDGQSASGRLFIRSDDGTIFKRLAVRLQEHLSRTHVDRQFQHRSASRQHIAEHDAYLFKVISEVGVQGKSLFWDGAFINDFLAQPTVFKNGRPSNFSLQAATSWAKKTAIGDLLLVDNQRVDQQLVNNQQDIQQCAASWEEKPKFHEERMSSIASAASRLSWPGDQGDAITGFYIELQGDSTYTCSAARNTIVQSEQHVYIQAVEQCYAYGTRYCIISGYLGHQLVYLAKSNLLLISETIKYSASKDGTLTAAAACVALCLPLASGEAADSPLPHPKDLGLDYTDDQTDQSTSDPNSTNTQSGNAGEGSGAQRTEPDNTDGDHAMDAGPTDAPTSQISRPSASGFPSFPNTEPNDNDHDHAMGTEPTEAPFNNLSPHDSCPSSSPSHPTPPKALKLTVLHSILGNVATSLTERFTPEIIHDVRLDIVSDYERIPQSGTSHYPHFGLPTPMGLATPPPSSLGSTDGSPPKAKRPQENVAITAAPLPTPPNSAELESRIVDLCPLALGSTCQTYSGYMSELELDVVVKVVAEKDAPKALHEAEVYELIRDSMSGLIPRFVGLYRSAPSAEDDFYAIVTEFAGESLAERHDAWSTVSVPLKGQIWRLFESLHALHVVHQDIQLRHLRLSPYTRKLCIIDFGQAEMNASTESIADEREYLIELLGD